MINILLGLIGAAVGILLYRLGWQSARRTPQAGRPNESPKGIMAALSPQEMQNFLNYDGGVMPKEETI